MDNQHEPEALDGQGAAIEPDYGGHPLFPRAETETGPDLRKIDIIQIIRTYPGTNVTETCPYVWKASELRGWDQVVEPYGGGCTYTAIGYEKKTHKITARSKPQYFGSPPPKPFVPIANPPPIATGPQPNSPPQQPVPVQAAPAGLGSDMAALVHAMVESNTKLICTLFAQSKQPQESALEGILRGVVVPLIERQQQPPPQQNTLEVVREIVPLIKGNGDSSKSGGANYERGIERGLELGRTLGGGAPQADDLGEITKLLGLFKSATGSASPPPPVPPPPPPPPPPPTHGYAMPALPPPPPGWEWAHTPMGIVMRPISSAYMPQQYAPQHYAPPPVPPAPPPPPAPPIPPQYPVPAPAPVQYAPAPVPPAPPPPPVHAPAAMPPAPPEPVHSQPMPVQPVSPPVAPAPTPVSPEPPAQVPLVSKPAPIPFSPPNVPLQQPVGSSPIASTPNAPITQSVPVTEIVPIRRTPKGVAPFLTAAGFIHGRPDEPLNGAPDNPIAAALGDGAALLQDPEFMQKAAAFMAGDLSPDKLAELLAAAEKAGGK